MGKLWKIHKIETYKEIISSFREPAGSAVAACFGISARDTLLCRTYRVFSNRKPIMIITEKFPEFFFV